MRSADHDSWRTLGIKGDPMTTTPARKSWVWCVIALALLLARPAAAFAQGGSPGTIAGSVKDTTGAVMPGVTVEASSPALIEKTRSVVTDAEGLYKIVDLRPGTYTVSFSLQGFATVKQE